MQQDYSFISMCECECESHRAERAAGKQIMSQKNGKYDDQRTKRQIIGRERGEKRAHTDKSAKESGVTEVER